MTDDQNSRSPSEDLVRRAQESIREEPTIPPLAEGSVGGSGAVPEAVPEAPRLRYQPQSAPSVRYEPDSVPRPDAPVDYRRGLVFAVAAAVAGAVVWALILAYAEIQAWLIGIGIGYLIGIAAIRGAGKVTNQLRVAVIALTIGAVIVGELLGTALLINKELGFFDFPFAVELYFDNLGGDFAFALGAAAVGCWAALSATRK